ncbi:class I SAM-dependent methyltransferase [bacterium]|jgi:hypothetical protein|nr:class I SAM-dependent methyltransferase [bacterium]
MKCRHCGTLLSNVFVDLESSPPSNSYLDCGMLKVPEQWYPLKVMVCDYCWLVQTMDIVDADKMFSDDYAYFSSYSSSWLNHASDYVNTMVVRFNLNDKSNVVEIAANDGYLLQYIKEKDMPCYGIEPTHSTAIAARKKGIEIIEEFFSEGMAKELVVQKNHADLMIANNVLAHVPNINDFLKGFVVLLKAEGIATFEFPHLLNLVQNNQFDTIYHEHYSYLSLTAIQTIFKENGLCIFDVEELTTHGGSLRVYSQRNDTGIQVIENSVNKLITLEKEKKVCSLKYYQNFQCRVEKIKIDFLDFLIQAKKSESMVIAYGAAAKGNTIMNFSGIHSDLISYVVDKNPNKVGKYMPGSRLPIVEESTIRIDKPKYIVIFPWNIKEEVMSQLSYISEWNGNFVIAIPELEIIKA